MIDKERNRGKERERERERGGGGKRVTVLRQGECFGERLIYLLSSPSTSGVSAFKGHY